MAIVKFLLGGRHDPEGNIAMWWSNDTWLEFLDRAICFVMEYSNITDPTTGMQLNGIKTLAENIADAGGITLAYQVSTGYPPMDGPTLSKLRLPTGVQGDTKAERQCGFE